MGRQKGRNIELCTSFEMKMEPSKDNANEDIDLEFLNSNIGQCNKLYLISKKILLLKNFNFHKNSKS